MKSRPKDQYPPEKESTERLDSSVRLVKCQFHPSESYTNFCCSHMCMQPLCPDCIESHSQDHRNRSTFPDIQSIKTIKIRCKAKLQKLLASLESLCDEADEATEYLPPRIEANKGDERHQQQLILKQDDKNETIIKQCRDRVIQIVKDFFEQIMQEYEKKQKQLKNDNDQIKQIQSRLFAYIETIEIKTAQLEGQTTQLDALKDVCLLDWAKDIDQISEQIRLSKQPLQISQQMHLQNENNLINVEIDYKQLQLFKQTLQKYISLSHNNPKNFQKPDSLLIKQDSNIPLNEDNINFSRQSNKDFRDKLRIETYSGETNKKKRIDSQSEDFQIKDQQHSYTILKSIYPNSNSNFNHSLKNGSTIQNKNNYVSQQYLRQQEQQQGNPIQNKVDQQFNGDLQEQVKQIKSQTKAPQKGDFDDWSEIETENQPLYNEQTESPLNNYYGEQESILKERKGIQKDFLEEQKDKVFSKERNSNATFNSQQDRHNSQFLQGKKRLEPNLSQGSLTAEMEQFSNPQDTFSNIGSQISIQFDPHTNIQPSEYYLQKSQQNLKQQQKSQAQLSQKQLVQQFKSKQISYLQLLQPEQKEEQVSVQLDIVDQKLQGQYQDQKQQYQSQLHKSKSQLIRIQSQQQEYHHQNQPSLQSQQQYMQQWQYQQQQQQQQKLEIEKKQVLSQNRKFNLPLNQLKLEEFEDQDSLKIEIQDYFEPNCRYKYFPYLSADFKQLFLIDFQNNNQIHSHYKIQQSIGEGHKLLVIPSGMLFILGGVDQEGLETNDVWCFDYQTGQFKERAKMITPRSQFSVVWNDGYIYAIGGRNNGKVLQECEKYDIQYNKWQSINSLNVPVSSASICSFQHKFLFKFGGLGQNDRGSSHSNNFLNNMNSIILTPRQNLKQKNSSIDSKLRTNQNKNSFNFPHSPASSQNGSCHMLTARYNYEQQNGVNQEQQHSSRSNIEYLQKLDRQNNNIIEQYCISTNKWNIIKFNNSNINLFQLNFLSGTAQVSHQSIFIFGGQYQKNPTKSSFSLQICRNENANDNFQFSKQFTYNVSNFDIHPLPTEGTFLSNPIIHDGRLYALQNIGLPSKQNHKRLLQFDGHNWRFETLEFV